MTNRVDAAVDAMQSADPYSRFDRGTPEPEVQELWDRHDSVLTRGEISQREIE